MGSRGVMLTRATPAIQRAPSEVEGPVLTGACCALPTCDALAPTSHTAIVVSHTQPMVVFIFSLWRGRTARLSKTCVAQGFSPAWGSPKGLRYCYESTLWPCFQKFEQVSHLIDAHQFV